MLKLIIFDMDDTLYPEEAYIRSGFRAVAELLAGSCGEDAVFVEAELWKMYLQDAQQVFDRFIADRQISTLSVRDLVQCYRTHHPDIKLQPEASELLNRLRGSFKLGLLSDGWLAVQELKVQALGLDPLMDFICLTDRWGVGYWKPHRRGFEHVLNKLGVDPQDACYVGDNPKKDFVAPNQLGMYSVCVATGSGVYRDATPPPGGEPNVYVNSLLQLPNVLASR